MFVPTHVEFGVLNVPYVDNVFIAQRLGLLSHLSIAVKRMSVSEQEIRFLRHTNLKIQLGRSQTIVISMILYFKKQI